MVKNFMFQSCQLFVRILVICALAVPMMTRPADTEVIISKSFSYFAVGGRTPEELDRELNRRGPFMKSSGMRHPGATQMKFGGKVSYEKKDGRCRIADATVTLDTKLILPRWSNRNRAERDMVVIWDALAGDIKRHEERHAEIARIYARKIEKSIRKLRTAKTCDILEKQVAEKTSALMEEHDREQARFDRTEAINFENRMVRLLKYRLEQLEKRK